MMGAWPGMMGYGFGNWLTFVVMVVILLYPIGRILGRIGFSPFWSLVALIPFFNVIALWVLAFADWPDRARPGPSVPVSSSRGMS